MVLTQGAAFPVPDPLTLKLPVRLNPVLDTSALAEPARESNTVGASPPGVKPPPPV